MGTSTSKAARKLPSRGSKPTWAGARTAEPNAATPGPRAGQETAHNVMASETRSEAIEADSRDPQFMANLSRLGQVRVSHPEASFRASEQATNMLRSREESEEQASSYKSIRNRMPSYTLTELLDERKTVSSETELDALAKKYNLDRDVLDRVATFVNTPSVGEGIGPPETVVNGVETTTMTAVWEDPILDEGPKQIR